MVNRVWSSQEEKVYWEVIIPKSPKRIGVHRTEDGHDWDVCAEMMQKLMKDDARRNYTSLSLCTYCQLPISSSSEPPFASCLLLHLSVKGDCDNGS